MILSLLYFIGYVAGAPAEDLVDGSTWAKFKIPYAGKMYSGYLPIDDAGKKQFHYFAFPAFSLAGPLQATFPLVLWLNGGPGCSSLYGAMVENGPFTVELGTNNFKQNLFTWLNFANMFYLESPAGVGFSFGNTTTDDKSTAKDNLKAVLEFFKKFPEYKSIDFYIAGESWAGIYIPTLANEIIDYNAKAAVGDRIRLKGLMIGNGCTDPTECTDLGFNFPVHFYKFLHNHGFISEKLNHKIENMTSYCHMKSYPECIEIYGEVMEQINGDDDYYFNPYNVYGKCYQLPFYNEKGERVKEKRFKLHPMKEGVVGQINECSESEALFLYLNNAAFRKALHIRDDAGYWNDCSNIDYKKDPGATYHLYPKLLKNGIRILKFSGDVDSIVPITGTLYWIDKLQKELNLPTIEEWRPWYKPGEKGSEQQNAGNVWEIDGLTFVSVRNAGHMVPMDQPEAASIMASHFIFEMPLPSDIL
ncbi:unnamed protein product [Paramecium pentaurelia]|uniref:Uncharacterized protein n=1 Tax=Paramecium pentaurelia TaxID=43138 RepID=A0A8S1WC62_9CILI|nr:unnamed protein product [Paramecium pentaurelia]